MQNISLKKWKGGAASPGAWICLSEVHTAEMLARMGFDWLCFDLQHGLISEAQLQALIPAISGTDATPIVRVVSNDAGQIGRALDAGAHGIIVPMVNSAEEARRAASACRYPMEGTRSCGPLRGFMLDGPDYLRSANAEVACIVMIETSEGLEQVEAIAATPGVDAIFIGPMDLCFGLGLVPGDFGAPAFVAAIARIRAACAAAGKAVGLFGYSPELAGQALKDGFNFVSVGTDLGFLRQGTASAIAAAGGLGQQETRKPGGY